MTYIDGRVPNLYRGVTAARGGIDQIEFLNNVIPDLISNSAPKVFRRIPRVGEKRPVRQHSETLTNGTLLLNTDAISNGRWWAFPTRWTASYRTKGHGPSHQLTCIITKPTFSHFFSSCPASTSMSKKKVVAILPTADAGTEPAPISSSHELSDELARFIQEKGLVQNQDEYIQWYPRNPKHPRNWTAKRKAFNTAVILLLEFITCVGRRAARVAKQM